MLRPEEEEGVELVVLTLWESMKPFAGSPGQSRIEGQSSLKREPF